MSLYKFLSCDWLFGMVIKFGLIAINSLEGNDISPFQPVYLPSGLRL